MMRFLDSACLRLVFIFVSLVVETEAFSCSSSPFCSAASSPLFRKIKPHIEVSSTHLREQSWAKAEETTVAVSSTKLREKHQRDVVSIDESINKVNVPALHALGYPQGFRKVLTRGAQIYSKRYWILDDSLSMATRDGHFLLYTKRSTAHGGQEELLEMAPCTRWNELQETCLQHALVAVHLGVHTDFRLLNCPHGHFRVPRCFGARGGTGSGSPGLLADVQHGQRILSRAKPRGVTPLRERLQMVNQEVRSILPKLGSGQKVLVVLATDGLPTEADEQGMSTPHAKDALKKALQALPPQVSVTIRLCTDDGDVVDYYHDLEATLPNVAVLDDYWAEAARVEQHNPWLTYGVVLHRMREMAGCVHVPLLKQLSQRPLTPTEVADFCQLVFDWETAPDSWEELCRAVQDSRQEMAWNPIRSQLEPWMDLSLYSS